MFQFLNVALSPIDMYALVEYFVVFYFNHWNITRIEIQFYLASITYNENKLNIRHLASHCRMHAFCNFDHT